MSNLSIAINRARASAKETLKNIERSPCTHVDVFAVAKSLGVTIAEPIAFESDQISGFLKRNSESIAEIVVNKNHNPERQRFTIAHEIGHFVLHARELLHVDDNVSAQPAFFRDAESSKATKLKEIEANQFAAELLMPSDEIQDLVKQKIEAGESFDIAVLELADTYQVSQIAMTIKIGASVS